MLKKFSSFACSVLLTLVSIAPMNVFAAEENATNIPNSPSESYDRNTPISIEQEGVDALGAALALKLKENLNASNLFSLEQKDTPKFRLLVSTTPEFADRPQVGSAYAIVWVFSQSEANLRHYISREVGIITEDNIDAIVAKVIEKTDGLSVRYSYLLPE